MPTIVVNTAADTIAADGKTSLREAVAQAAGMTGNVDIVFDTATFYNSETFAVTAIQLTQTLIIAANVTIDGSLFYAGSARSVKISGAALPTNAVTVEAGATATLRDLTIEGSSGNIIEGSNGAEGSPGENGVDGEGIPNGLPFLPSPTAGTDGTSGTHGTDAGDAPNDAGKGLDAVGGIVNRGTLTLERVDIRNFRVEGGTGGVGGEGGKGGAGGNGEAGSPDAGPDQSGGNGGNGGNSGDGARGGDGGVAAAAIYNSGTLTLRDTMLSGVNAKGGHGGQGGDGARGGHGGSYGISNFDAVSKGGNGGNGGDGGNGGNGGSAAALFNGGTLIIEGRQAAVQGAVYTAGFGGTGGDLGEFGVQGGAYASSSPNPPQVGLNGLPGVDGSTGGNGATGDFVGANVTTGASFIVDSAREVISEKANADGRLVYFNVRLLGGSASAAESVKWEIVPGKGFTNADFELITATSGTLTFEGSITDKLFGYRVAKDGKSEGIESFTVKLSDPSGGVLGWSKSVTVYITDGDEEGNAPTSIKLSDTSLNENSKNNTRLGSLSTTDGDKGDQFTYELINTASGRYKLSGNTIKVADSTRLDYEQAKSHTITVRSTDLFGNSIDKKIKITLADVDGEKINGNSSSNKLYGGDGRDTITGAGGNDTLKGGADSDRFVFDRALDAATNVDHLADFKHDTDKIVLDKDIFTKLSGSTLKAAAFHTGATSHDASDRILYQKSTGKLFYDADGDKPGAVPILFAILDTRPTLDAGDFLIV
jgi:hypothetical protein